MNDLHKQYWYRVEFSKGFATNHKFTPAFLKKLFLIYCVYRCIAMCTWVQVPEKARGIGSPWNRVTDGCKPPDMEHNSGPLGVEYLLLHSEPFLQPPYWLFLKQTWEDSRHSQHTYSLTTLTSISTWTARRAATRILFQSTHTLSTCSEQLSKAPPSTPMVNRVT